MHVLTVLGLSRGRETEDERKEGEEGSEREARHSWCLCFGPGDLQLFCLVFSFFSNVHANHPRLQFNN